MYQLGNGLQDLLKDLCSAGRQVTIVHSSLGPLTGRIIAVMPDYIHLKIFDTKLDRFYNEYVPCYTVVGIETQDEDVTNEKID